MITKEQLTEWLGKDRAEQIDTAAPGALETAVKRANEQPLAVAGFLALRTVGSDPTPEDWRLLNGETKERAEEEKIKKQKSK
jgi:hypothetical protein